MKTHPTILLLSLTALCSGCQSFRDCSTVDTSAAQALPDLLSLTGLYSDIENKVINEAAIEFKPQFPLWTDGATKRRWLLLPEGEQVDTQDLEDWVFPVGTQFFKEFERDGVVVETRMNLHTEDGWAAVTYLWNDSGDDAEHIFESVVDASGTAHDIPSAAECLACHAGRRNFALGFSATQLDGETRAALLKAGVLSEPVEAEITLDSTVKAGLGVLHGNCSHCHNTTRDTQALATDCYAPVTEDEDEPLDFSLPADLGAVENAPVLLTGRWLLGRPGDSEVLDRMSSRNQSERNPSMPPLGTELVDEEGVEAVEALIEVLSESDL